MRDLHVIACAPRCMRPFEGNRAVSRYAHVFAARKLWGDNRCDKAIQHTRALCWQSWSCASLLCRFVVHTSSYAQRTGGAHNRLNALGIRNSRIYLSKMQHSTGTIWCKASAILSSTRSTGNRSQEPAGAGQSSNVLHVQPANAYDRAQLRCQVGTHVTPSASAAPTRACGWHKTPRGAPLLR